MGCASHRRQGNAYLLTNKASVPFEIRLFIGCMSNGLIATITT
jgi:hypothetical protein